MKVLLADLSTFALTPDLVCIQDPSDSHETTQSSLSLLNPSLLNIHIFKILP